MKTYPLTRNDSSHPFAFEVENTLLGTTTVARLLAEIDGVSDVQPRKMFARSSDVHVEFKFRGQPYIVWEPFGDNSRYWIGPKDEASDAGEIGVLEGAFNRHRPLFHRVIDVVAQQFQRRRR